MQNTFVKPTVDQTLQAVSSQLKALETEFSAYYSAHCFDPDDVQNLFVLVGAELKKAVELVDSSLLIEFLVFHREKIQQNLLDHIYKMLARDYAGANAVAKKKDLLSRAENYIESQMITAITAGDDEAQRVRDELMQRMGENALRAELLIGIGDVYLIHHRREKDALRCYRDAFKENSDNQDAFERLFAVAEHLGEWDDAFAALDRLKRIQSEYLVSYLCKEAWILGKKQGKYAKAIEIYDKIMESHPLYLDVFIQLIEALQATQDFAGIKTRFVSMLKRGEGDKSLSVEARLAYELRLGKIGLLNLRSIPVAILIYRSASTLAPGNRLIHEILLRLYQEEGDVDKMIEEYHEILRIQPQNSEVLLELARFYREIGRFDESLCCYRVLDAKECQDETCQEIVDNFKDLDLPEISRIPDELWRYIIPGTMDGHLIHLLKICATVAGDLFANEFSTYNIHPKTARIDVFGESLFNRVISNEASALGFAEVPNLYRCDRFFGITNAYFIDRSFLIHPSCLAGRSSQELAFMTSKALLLMRPEYYLLQQGVANVDLILRAIMKTIRPNLDIELDKNQEQVSKTLVKGLSAEQIETLGKIIDEMQMNTPYYNIQLFFESAEEFANRVGLLFCDDLSVINRLLAEEEKPISVRMASERFASIMLWAISEDYFTLRKKLNIGLQA